MKNKPVIINLILCIIVSMSTGAAAGGLVKVRASMGWWWESNELPTAPSICKKNAHVSRTLCHKNNTIKVLTTQKEIDDCTNTYVENLDECA
jgi:hypothetical protein